MSKISKISFTECCMLQVYNWKNGLRVVKSRTEATRLATLLCLVKYFERDKRHCEVPNTTSDQIYLPDNSVKTNGSLDICLALDW